jgi:predicted nucleic acid-binding protein
VTLVDTSVWIDFFAGRDQPHIEKLEHLISEDEDIALCGIIVTEILQGIADDAACRRVLRRLGPLIILPMPDTVFVEAANIYRKLRKKGITIRKSNDCIIAATALEHRCKLLHNDRDFAPISEHFSLQVAGLT